MAVEFLSSVSEKDDITIKRLHPGLKWRQHILLYTAQAVVALISGGMVSTLARVFGITGTWSFAIGAIAGAVILAWRVVHIICQSEASSDNTALLLPDATAQIVRITNIVNAAAVLDLEDFGPGYVVETAEGDRVYFSGQVVAEHDHDGESLSTTVVLEVVGKDVIGVEAYGEVVPVALSQSVPISQLAIAPTDGFAVLH